MKDAVNEFTIEESGLTITVTVTVSGEGNSRSDRDRVEYYGERIANRMFIKSAKDFGPKRLKFTKAHERENMLARMLKQRQNEGNSEGRVTSDIAKTRINTDK